MYSKSDSEVYGPAATAMVQDCLGSPLFLPVKRGNWQNDRNHRPNTHTREYTLTDRISDTWNQSPVAFRPLNAAIAPGKKPTELVPGRAPRILRLGLNLIGPRVPASIILDVSR